MNLPNQSVAREEQLRRDASSKKQLSSIWEVALQEYKEKTGRDMKNSATIKKASDLSKEMEETEKAFDKKRKGAPVWQKTRKVLNDCAVLLQAGSAVVAGVIGLTPAAPAGVIFSAGIFLIDTCKSVTEAYDLIEELLEECKTFTENLQTLSEIEMQHDLVVKLTVILKFITDIFVQCEEVVRNGHFVNWLHKVRGKGRDDILQRSRDRLERYFNEQERSTIAYIHVTTERMSSNVSDVKELNQRSKVRSVIESLSTGSDMSEVATKRAEFNSKSEHTSPTWIEREEAYKTWIEKARCLWVLGNVGAGKTTLASYLAASLSAQSKSSIGRIASRRLVNGGINDQSSQYSLSQTAVALFYGSYDVQGEQRRDLVFQSLIRQLLQQLQGHAIERALARCEQVDKYRTNVTEDDRSMSWAKILNDIASEFQDTFILVDALDKEESGYRGLIEWLRQLKSPSIKLFVTSRDEKSMRSDVHSFGAISMTIDAESKIASYVRSRLELIRDYPDDSGGSVITALPQILKETSDLE